jgi:hypothetical protein
MFTSVVVLSLLFAVAQAQGTGTSTSSTPNANNSSTLDPTITGIIAAVGVVVSLGLAFLLWRVFSPAVAAALSAF